MSGASTTASMLGQPDLAIATQNDFIQVVFFFFFGPEGLTPLISCTTMTEREYDRRSKPSNPLNLRRRHRVSLRKPAHTRTNN
jgi:hypothetical protein